MWCDRVQPRISEVGRQVSQKRKTQMSRKWSLWVLSGGHKCLSFKPTIFCLMLFPLLKNVAIASAPLLLASLATSAVCSFEAPALACGLRNHGAKSIWIYWTNGKAGKKCATNSCKAESVVFFGFLNWLRKYRNGIKWHKDIKRIQKDTKSPSTMFEVHDIASQRAF